MEKKTAYEMATGLEFRRVLFRSRRLSVRQAREAVRCETGRHVERNAVIYAHKRFDALHGHPDGPLDVAQYATADEAARNLGVSRRSEERRVGKEWCWKWR